MAGHTCFRRLLFAGGIGHPVLMLEEMIKTILTDHLGKQKIVADL